jgi:hypothetical protein
MADPLTLGAIAKLGVESKGLALSAMEGMKTAGLDALRTQLTGGQVLDGLAQATGWSLTDLHGHADTVLRVAGAETKHVESFLTAAESCDAHDVAHELPEHSQQGERLGLEAAKKHLQANGFTCVREFGGGGPDGAMPDILCRGPDGRPWVVEVKGTQSGTKLKDMGLDRGPDGAGGTTWENSPGWLQTGGEHTLAEMDQMLAAGPDPELRALRDDYADLVDNGFDDSEAYGNMVVHAGDDLPVLDPSDLHGKVADYVKQVQPDLIVQIHTDNYDA